MRDISSASESALAIGAAHPVPAPGLIPPAGEPAVTSDDEGIAQMKMPPSDPTLTIILRSGEIRTAATLPLCPAPMLVVKPSS